MHLFNTIIIWYYMHLQKSTFPIIHWWLLYPIIDAQYPIYIYDTSHLIISIPMANILNCGIVSSNYSIYMISIYVYIYTYLVGGLEHEFYFFHILYWEVHNQLTNSIIFQRGRAQPPTRYVSKTRAQHLHLDFFQDMTSLWYPLVI